MKKLLLLLAVVSLWLVLPLGSGEVSAATNWGWQVGGALHDAELLHFMPHSATIAVGDSITWTIAEGAPHTITFLSGAPRLPTFAGLPFAPGRLTLNPAVAGPSHPGPAPTYNGSGFFNSGLLDPGMSWTLAFGTPGKFEFICLLHRGMKADVTVVAAGTPLPETPEQVAAGIGPGVADHIRAIGRATTLQLRRTQTTVRSDGTTEWQVNTGGAWASPAFGAIPQGFADMFTPNRLSIHTGDTVKWNFTSAFHTVTFFGPEGPPSDLAFFDEIAPPPGILPPGAPPTIPFFNRRFFESSSNVSAQGTASYDGTGFLNSAVRGVGVDGTILDDFPGAPAIYTDTMLSSSFSTTFTKAGTYNYLCMVHPGMFGMIEVQDRAAWPPVHVELTSQHDGQRVTYYATLRNFGNATVEGATVALEIPTGSQVVSSGYIHGGNPGAITARDVLWALPNLNIATGGAAGPFVLVVDVPTGADPHTALSQGWTAFRTATGATGTAVSAEVGPDAPPPPFPPPGP